MDKQKPPVSLTETGDAHTTMPHLAPSCPGFLVHEEEKQSRSVQAGLLASGSSALPHLPGRSHRPVVYVVEGLPGYSGGPTTEFHRLPSSCPQRDNLNLTIEHNIKDRVGSNIGLSVPICQDRSSRPAFFAIFQCALIGEVLTGLSGDVGYILTYGLPYRSSVSGSNTRLHSVRSLSTHR